MKEEFRGFFTINNFDKRYLKNYDIDNRLLQNLLQEEISKVPNDFNPVSPTRGRLVGRLWNDAHKQLEKNYEEDMRILSKSTYSGKYISSYNKRNKSNKCENIVNTPKNIFWGMTYQRKYELPTISSMTKAKHPFLVQYRKMYPTEITSQNILPTNCEIRLNFKKNKKEFLIPETSNKRCFHRMKKFQRRSQKFNDEEFFSLSENTSSCDNDLSVSYTTSINNYTSESD